MVQSQHVADGGHQGGRLKQGALGCVARLHLGHVAHAQQVQRLPTQEQNDHTQAISNLTQ